MRGTASVFACLGLLLAASTCFYAQSTVVYTNNDPPGPNSISAFYVDADRNLIPVPGSPFSTGGSGSGLGVFAMSRIVVTTPGNFLYAANDSSNTISGFSINTATGELTPLPGSPFPAESSNEQISLAATPDGKFLYAGRVSDNPSSSVFYISAFNIASNGALTAIPGSPFTSLSSPINMKVSPDGQFLAVAGSSSGVGMFSIGPDGALTPVPGSPFLFSGGVFESVDVNCAANLLFATSYLGAVDVLEIASNGVLAPIAGSPFRFDPTNYLIGVLSPDGQFLFVSTYFSSQTIMSLHVAPGGSLDPVSGSPFPSQASLLKAMATDQSGTLLFGADALGNVIGLSIDSDGALSLLPNSHYPLGISGSAPSLTVFPPMSCAVKAGLRLSTTRLTFAAQPVNATSTGQAVTLTNGGNLDVAITKILASGDFAQTNDCGTSLAAGASCAVSVTFAPTAAGVCTGTLTITDNGAGSPHRVGLNGTGADFAIVVAGADKMTVNAGQAVVFNLSLVPFDFVGSVSLACSGTPLAGTCVVNPTRMSFAGHSLPAMVTVTTTARSNAATSLHTRSRRRGAAAAWLSLLGLPVCCWIASKARRRRGAAPGTIAIMVLVLAMLGCGGGGRSISESYSPIPQQIGTPAGTYMVTVTASSGPLTHNMSLTVEVN